MIWEIEEKEDVLWYTSDICQLRLVKDEQKKYIYLNYNGYNIVLPMEMWGFYEEVVERGIKYSIEGDSMENWCFKIESKDLRLFVDLVYLFLKEHNVDAMVSPDLAIKKWG
jgi:hypothetical protein